MGKVINLCEYPDILSVRATAKLLKTSRTEVYRIINAGYIKEIMVSEKKMITRASVEYYKSLKDQIKEIEAQIKMIAEEGLQGGE